MTTGIESNNAACFEGHSIRNAFGRVLCLVFSAGFLLAATPAGAQTTVTIGGEIYRAASDGLGGPVYAPAAVAVPNARVMIQTQDSEAAIVAYGAVAGNSWTASVACPGEYVVMISAPGHDATSREFVWPLAADCPVSGSAGVDAYLPPLPLPGANLLYYAFYDNMINTGDDWPTDPPLNGVVVTACPVRPEDGPCQVRETGSESFFCTNDAFCFGPGGEVPFADGFAYFRGLPPGEVIVTADPINVWSANNPSLAYLGLSATSVIYNTYTEEGGPAWDPPLLPGYAGTEAGMALIWHSFVAKLDQLGDVGNPNPAGCNTVQGILYDADINDPAEPWPNPAPSHVYPHGAVADGLAILWQRVGDTATALATVEADPITGAFQLSNIPDGDYKLFLTDRALEYVWQEANLTVAGCQTLDINCLNGGPCSHDPAVGDPNHDPFPTHMPRFAARGRGCVYDVTSGTEVPVQAPWQVNLRYRAGSVKQSMLLGDPAEYPGTPPAGEDPSKGRVAYPELPCLAAAWYNFNNMPEVEIMGTIDLEMPNNYRGAIRQETFNFCNNLPGVLTPSGASCVGGQLTPPWTTSFNGMGRFVQWLTANYRGDLYVEQIPPTTGDLRGFVYSDNLARGTWRGNGVYDSGLDQTMKDIMVELWNVPPPSLGSCVLGTEPSCCANNPGCISTSSGAFVSDGLLNQGWQAPDTKPVNEWGGVFVGSVPGFYEFRDLTPGNYTARVIAPNGFFPAIGAATEMAITVTAGLATVQDIGLRTLVPQSGGVEGGVFDDFHVDTNPFSLLFEEKAGITGTPVGAYDHFRYLLGVGYQGSSLCYAGAPPGQCPLGEPQLQAPIVDKRFAPGVHDFVGNDINADPAAFNPFYEPFPLPYGWEQGGYKFEADWSLVPTQWCFEANCVLCETCNPVQFVCSPQSLPAGTLCTVAGENPCIEWQCDGAGSCLPTTIPLPPAIWEPCDDGNPCTEDMCDGMGSCFHSAQLKNTLPCNDMNPCSTNDTCLGGVCAGSGAAPACGDGCVDPGEQCGEFDADGNPLIDCLGGSGSACSVSTCTCEGALAGDLNQDWTVNIVDALLIAQYVVELRSCYEIPGFDMCDVNSDSVCNIIDALKVAQCSVGLISCNFTMGAPCACP